MKIEVLGTGCAKCYKTADLIKEVISKTGVVAEVVKVENLTDIIKKGVMITPAVIVDGEIMIEGKIPTESQIKVWLKV